jgi:hypothetical protein
MSPELVGEVGGGREMKKPPRRVVNSADGVTVALHEYYYEC